MKINTETIKQVYEEMEAAEKSTGKLEYPELNYLNELSIFSSARDMLIAAALLGASLFRKPISPYAQYGDKGNAILNGAHTIFNPIFIKFALMMWKVGYTQGQNQSLEDMVKEDGTHT